MRTDYFDGLFDGLPPAPVTHVTHRQTDCVTTNPESITIKNSDLAESLRTLRTLRTEKDNSQLDEAAEAIAERDAGLPREQAETEAQRITHAYRYRLHGNDGGGIYITPGDLEAARRELVKRYGDRLALVALA